jgi:hypothetical protein
MEKFIPEKVRQECYYDWVRLRRCANNKIGDAFVTHLNVARTIEDNVNEEELIENYEKYMNKKLEIVKKELKLEAEEGEGEGEEEAAEEEGGEEEAAPAEEGGEEAAASQDENAEKPSDESELARGENEDSQKEDNQLPVSSENSDE